jgi:hypothetical protein
MMPSLMVPAALPTVPDQSLRRSKRRLREHAEALDSPPPSPPSRQGTSIRRAQEGLAVTAGPESEERRTRSPPSRRARHGFGRRRRSGRAIGWRRRQLVASPRCLASTCAARADDRGGPDELDDLRDDAVQLVPFEFGAVQLVLFEFGAVQLVGFQYGGVRNSRATPRLAVIRLGVAGLATLGCRTGQADLRRHARRCRFR